MIKIDDKVEYTAMDYADSETVGKVEDLTVFVPQMISGEKAEVRINYVNIKKNIAYGNIERLLVLSPLRETPPCPYFGCCGGCSLMHMNYAEQLCFKQNKVKNNIKKLSGIDCNVFPTVASSKILGYRNKISLPVRGCKGNVKIGMYQKGSHSIVNTQECLLVGMWSKKLVAVFRAYMNENNIEPYNENDFSGQVRHLVARFIDGQMLVTVVCNGKPCFDLQPLIKLLQQNFECFGLFINENTLKNNVIMGKVTRHIYGLKGIESEHLGVKFRLQPDSFFQVNDEIKNKIYKKVKELLDLSRTQILIDAFSGVGILTNVLASVDYQTIAVEIVPQAVEDARRNAMLNQTSNITNICGDANIVIPKIVEKHCDKIISLLVDPPRKGLGMGLCETIINTRIDNIVYISCDSATLARDLKQLSSAYTVDYVQPYDMFPQTAEIETVVHLKRR